MSKLKLILIIAVAVIFAAGDVTAQKKTQTQIDQPLFSVRQDGKYGYIDKTGKLVIPYQFRWAGDFREGLASVKKDSGGKCGYIDRTGKLVIPYQYDRCSYGDFENGLAKVMQGDKIGFIDKTGKLVYPWWNSKKYEGSVEEEEECFQRDGIATLVASGTYCNGWQGARFYGCIDRSGRLIIPAQYYSPLVISSDGYISGYRMFKGKDGLCHKVIEVFDKTGRPIQFPGVSFVSYFSEGLAGVEGQEPGGKYGYIDKTGKLVIPCQFEQLPLHHTPDEFSFSDGMAMVQLEHNGKYGYIDKTGKLIVPCEYDDVWIENGLVCLEKDEKWTYIDKTGKVIWQEK
ncbi:MAG: WG repeat-containing protein [Ignavibacteria bacterium]|jgi:hypothetical protein|nr:WG repeat-containing protein [Ignavibacteria bacterium]